MLGGDPSLGTAPSARWHARQVPALNPGDPQQIGIRSVNSRRAKSDGCMTWLVGCRHSGYPHARRGVNSFFGLNEVNVQAQQGARQRALRGQACEPAIRQAPIVTAHIAHQFILRIDDEKMFESIVVPIALCPAVNFFYTSPSIQRGK